LSLLIFKHSQSQNGHNFNIVNHPSSYALNCNTQLQLYFQCSNMHPNSQNLHKRLQAILVLYDTIFRIFCKTYNPQKLIPWLNFPLKQNYVLEKFITPIMHRQNSWNFVVAWKILLRIYSKNFRIFFQPHNSQNLKR